MILEQGFQIHGPCGTNYDNNSIINENQCLKAKILFSIEVKNLQVSCRFLFCKHFMA